MTHEATEVHRTLIVERPAVTGFRNTRRRAICSCGWQGETFDAQADAEAEADQHATGGTMIEQHEIATLNVARRTLSDIANRARMDHDSQESGMIYALAERNEHELFMLLNYFQNYAHGAIRDDQVVLDR